MSTKDTSTKAVMRDNRYFADIFNYFLYEGRQVIKEEDLREKDPAEIALPHGSNNQKVNLQKMRDILKLCVAKETNDAVYLILGIENQSEIHYAMPVRNMLYDSMNYSEQIDKIAKSHRKSNDKMDKAEFLSGFTKKDRLIPVITLVVYFGADEWDGPRTLHEMFEGYGPDILQFVPDYKMNIIVPSEIDDFDKFGTALRCLLEMVKCEKNKDEMEEIMMRTPMYQNIPKEIANAITDITHIKVSKKHKKGGSVNMCKAWEDQRKSGIEEGRKEGIEEGRKKGRKEGEYNARMKTLNTMIDNGLNDNTIILAGFTRKEIEKARKTSC